MWGAQDDPSSLPPATLLTSCWQPPIPTSSALTDLHWLHFGWSWILDEAVGLHFWDVCTPGQSLASPVLT